MMEQRIDERITKKKNENQHPEKKNHFYDPHHNNERRYLRTVRLCERMFQDFFMLLNSELECGAVASI